ncbi:MobQ family relaxase [Blautia sp.]|uniref:MobQ family relaxase n=1 Tax=Blautia sp. TaxID=1955243 RepID=UPI0025874E92|nr:MobQ family relaxase [Blautia sp.]
MPERPCPHHDIRIIQRSNRQSAVASAAYQSGERLFSEYDQKQKYYSHMSEIVRTEIMLPPHAPPEYADRNTLWNAAEAAEKQWNSQLARRIVLAIPRGIPPEHYTDLIRDYCREFFVSKGMIADFAIHDKGNGNPHAHILLTMRAMDESGKWLPKSRKVYDLDENGERIRLPSGRWKSHKEDTVDWNDQSKAEVWRQGWADTANRYLEVAGRPERLDLRSYERQGIDQIPTVHMGAAVSCMEKQGIKTNIGNLNRDIKAANSRMQSIRQMVRHLKDWIGELKEKKAALLEALQEAREPDLPELLQRYMELRQEERTGWAAKAQLKGTVTDFNRVMAAIDYLKQKGISTLEHLDTHLDEVSQKAVAAKAEIKKKETGIKAIDTTLTHIQNHRAHKEVYKEYSAIRWKKRKENYAGEHRQELDAYLAAERYFKAHANELPYDRQKLAERRQTLLDEVAVKNGELHRIQEDVKTLRDVRGWVNQVLPPDKRRVTAEPGKKPSIKERLNLKREDVNQREEQKRQPSRTTKQQNMEL